MTNPVHGYSPREQRGWCWYDAANSVFATSAITLFLPTYVPTLARAAADADGFVRPLGVPVYAPSYWAYLVGLSVLLQVLVLPVVGAVADCTRRKKEVLAATAFTGALAATAMFFLEGSGYLLAGGLFLAANVSFGASIVVYNSFLPEIAPPAERDTLSSRGWALGYAAGCVMLLAHLTLVSRAETLGLTTSMAVRVALASTGLWWMLGTLPVLARLRNRGEPRRLPGVWATLNSAFGQLWRTLRGMRRYPQTLRFLVAYLLYNDAIQTVLVVAAQFGAEELGLPVTALATTILISQFVGIFGALLFDRIARRIAAKRAVMLSLVVWTGLLFYAYAFVHSQIEFYVMGGFAGLVMGGSQALSRSMFAQLTPHGKEAEYFGIYEVGDKGTSWIGPPTFGLALQLTGSYRAAILSLLVFFLAGLGVLWRADLEQGAWDILQNGSA
jgi:UMF1 family MFS transporter